MSGMSAPSWRPQPTSKRKRLASLLSNAEDSIRAQSIGRVRECFNFFADFWLSTPHPLAQMLLVLGWATLVVTLNDTRVADAGIELDSSAGRTLTTILAFLIVFRTNQSYNRWWEGRILWGKMHASCVELSQHAATWIEDPRLAVRIVNFTIAFAFTVKKVLRREALSAEDLEGVVSAVEVERMNRLSLPVMPYYCLDVIRQCIKKGLTDHPQSFGVQAVARGIDIPVSQLAVQYADMSRVRNTLQPDCFRVMLHMFTVIYLLLLPVISYKSLGYWVIPEVLLTSYLMLGLQLAASDLEDPFGYDLSDLELDLYVTNIAKQCRAAFFIGEKSNVDLTLDDGGAGADTMPAAASLGEGGPGNTSDWSSHTGPMGSARGHSLDGEDRSRVEEGGGRRENGGSSSMGWPASPSPETSAPASLSPSGSARDEGESTLFVSGSGSNSSGTGAGGRDREPALPARPPQRKLSGGAAVAGAEACGNGDRAGLAVVAPSSSSVTLVPDVLVLPPIAPPSATTSGGGSGGTLHDRGRCRDRTGPAVSPSSSGGKQSSGSSFAKVLSIRHRAQEDLAPRRRSNSRPGRGKAPLEDEAAFATPPPPELRQYNFEMQENTMCAEVV